MKQIRKQRVKKASDDREKKKIGRILMRCFQRPQPDFAANTPKAKTSPEGATETTVKIWALG